MTTMSTTIDSVVDLAERAARVLCTLAGVPDVSRRAVRVATIERCQIRTSTAVAQAVSEASRIALNLSI